MSSLQSSYIPHHCIQERAYEIYCQRGRKGNHAESDWLTAEAELKELKTTVARMVAKVEDLTADKEISMTTIRENDFSVALINTFFVKQDNAEELVQLLRKATDEVMRHQPGFISANLHVSLDKTRVVNYAQWRSKEDFERMRQNPDAKPHLEEAAALAERFDPMLYTVAYVENRSDT